MLKSFFISVCLIHLLSSIFLINGMELALRTPEILNVIVYSVAHNYHKEIVENQCEIQETFNNNRTTRFDTSDVSLFFPKFPSCVCVNKTWNGFFQKAFRELCETQKTDLNLLTPYKYGPAITGIHTDILVQDILSIHPWSHVTQKQLENNIKTCITDEPERNQRLEHLKQTIELYQNIFFKNRKAVSSQLNLFLLTALELTSYYLVVYWKYRSFFYQLLFNSPLKNTFKGSFFNYLVENYFSVDRRDEIIQIALESPKFKIVDEKKFFWQWYEKLDFINHELKKEILLKIGFLKKEIIEQQQKKDTFFEKLNNERNFNQQKEDFKNFLSHFFSSNDYHILNDEWYFLRYFLKKLDNYLYSEVMHLLNIAVFFVQKELSAYQKYPLSHEEIATNLELFNYVNLYSWKRDSDMNFHYTFIEALHCEGEVIKNPSLLLRIMVSSSFSSFSSLIENQIKENIDTEYPHSMITNNNVIIFLLKKYFEWNCLAYNRDKMLMIFQKLFKLSEGLTEIIKQNPDLVENFKKNHKRVKEFKVNPEAQAFIEQLLPELVESSITKSVEQIDNDNQKKLIFFQFLKRNNIKILLILVGIGTVVKLFYKNCLKLLRQSFKAV